MGDVVAEMAVTDRLGRIWKSRQEKIEDAFERVEALEILRDAGIITQRDYWLLTGNYRVLEDC